jgi:hypothetical protein
MLPNWIIAGAPKAGTSSLFCWLVDHPQVSGSAEKETYYFVDPGTHMFSPQRNFARGGLTGYSKLFEACDPASRVIVESTPSYLYSETALRELPHLPTEPRFIFVLREPVSQLHSLFSYFQQNWNWIPRHMSFREFVAAAEQGSHAFNGNELAVNALRNARYTDHLRRWRTAVGQDRMFILLFEDLIQDSRAAMRVIATWMGIDPTFYEAYDFPAENKTYLARSGALQDLNIMVRSRLPQGRMYNALRRLYRAANTTGASRHGHDCSVDRQLAERYSEMLPELEKEFGLDLTKWRNALDAKTPRPDVKSSQCESDWTHPDRSMTELAAK